MDENIKPFRPTLEVSNKTYSMKVQCMNCGSEYSAVIPFGVIAAEADIECSRCGVTRKAIQEYWRKEQGPPMVPVVGGRL